MIMAGILLLGAAPTFGRSVLNAQYGTDQYLNIANNFGSFGGLTTPAASLNAGQYPTGVIPADYTGTISLNAYYSHYTVKWTGVSAFFVSLYPIIIYSGGAGVFNITPTATGVSSGNTVIYNQANQTSDMNVEMAFGALVTAVGTSSGLVQFSTASSAIANVTDQTQIKFSNLTGLGTGPNADGSWTLNKLDNQTFTLTGSASRVGLVSVTGTGGPGVQTDFNFTPPVMSFSFMHNVLGGASIVHTISNFIFAKTADMTAINGGFRVTQAVIDNIRTLKPKYLRFMDMMAGQGFYSDYNFRAPVDTLGYGVFRWEPSLYVGSTAGSSDAFTATNPGYVTGAYVDGEIVQVTANRNNTTVNPTIKLGTRATVPVFSNTYIPINLTLTGSPTTGDVIHVVFTASYFSGGVYTHNYTVTSGDTTLNTLMVSLVADLQADDTLFAQNIQFAGPSLGYYAPSRGSLVITSSVTGAATETLTIGTTAIGSIVSGSTHTFVYNALLGGFVNLGVNGITTSIPFEIFYEMCNRANVGAWFTLPAIFTEASTQSLGAAVAAGIPSLPVIVEYVNEIWNSSANPYNQVGALGTTLGWPKTGSESFKALYAFYALRTRQLFPKFSTGYTGAGGSRSNLQFVSMSALGDGDGSQSSFSLVPVMLEGQLLAAAPATFTGTISGTTLTATSVTGLIYPGFVIAGSGVTVGTRVARPISVPLSGGPGIYKLDTSQTVASPVAMSASNAIYTAVGGPNATTAPDYNVFPNRPVDILDGIGYASYYSGALAGIGAGSWSGTQSFYNTLFQASKDYATGVPASVTSALNAWDADLNTGTRNGVAGPATVETFNKVGGEVRAWESVAAAYDSVRAGAGIAKLSMYQYEGAYETTFASPSNIILPISPLTSPSDLNTQFTANGWTLSPTYGASNLIVATNIVNLYLAYVNSTQYYTTVLGFWNAMAAIHIARPNFSPAQYGIEGPATLANPNCAPRWGFLPGDVTTTPLQNYNAEAAFNH